MSRPEFWIWPLIFLCVFTLIYNTSSGEKSKILFGTFPVDWSCKSAAFYFRVNDPILRVQWWTKGITPNDPIKHGNRRFPVLFDSLKNYSYPKCFSIHILDDLADLNWRYMLLVNLLGEMGDLPVVWQLLVVASTWTNRHLIPATCQSSQLQ